MKTAARAIIALLVVQAFAFAPSHAAHCKGTKTSKATSHDPFGSCEDGGTSSYGNVRCGSGTDVSSLGRVIVKNDSAGTGVQACNDKDSNTTPVQGRVTVYRQANGNIIVASDGDDQWNPSHGYPQAASWTRLDLNPTAGSCRARIRRGGGGSYWDGSGSVKQNDNGNTCTG